MALLSLLVVVAATPILIFFLALPKTRAGRSYYIAKAMNGSSKYPMGKMIWLNPKTVEQEGDQLSLLGSFELKRVDPDGHEHHLRTLTGWVNLDLMSKGKPALDQQVISIATSQPLQRLEFATTNGQLHYLSLLTQSGTTATVGVDVL